MKEIEQKESGTGIMRNRFPGYTWVCLGIIIGFLILVYYGGKIATSHRMLHVLTGPLDEKIPFIPAWVTVYCSAYLIWIFSAVWILSESREFAYRTTAEVVFALLASGIVFIAWPGVLVRPEVFGNGFFDEWVRQIYRLDTPTNLCPSLHVLLSYLCWRKMTECKRIRKWIQASSFGYLILICLSVLFIKQHALVDIPAAILIGEFFCQAGKKWKMGQVLCRMEKAENYLRIRDMKC